MDDGRQRWPLKGDRARLARATRAALQLQRDVATGRIKKAATSIIARGGVTFESATDEVIELAAEDPMGREAVLIRPGEGRAAEVTCRCPTMKRMGGCHHALAGLESLFVELSRPAPEPTPAPAAEGSGYLSRIEAIGARLAKDRRGRASAAGAADPWRALALRSEEVRYVVRFAGRIERAAFVLEAEARPRPVAGAGAASPWRSVPFGTSRASGGPTLDDFGPAHAAVAAIARGAVDAERAATDGRRDLSLARLDRFVAGALLGAAEEAAGPVLFRSPGKGRGGAPLASLRAVMEATCRLELAAAETAEPELTILGAIRLPSGDREPLPSVVAVGPSGLVALLTGTAEVTLAVLECARGAPRDRRAPEGALRIPKDDAMALASLRSVATVVGTLGDRAATPAGPRGVPAHRVPHRDPRRPRHGLPAALRLRRGPWWTTAASTRWCRPSMGGPSPGTVTSRTRRPCASSSSGRAARGRCRRRARWDGPRRPLRRHGRDPCGRGLARGRPGSPGARRRSGDDLRGQWRGLVRARGGRHIRGRGGAAPTLLRAASENRGFVTLADGSRGLLPETWLERWRLAALGDATEDGKVRFDRTQGWILAELADQASAEVTTRFAP